MTADPDGLRADVDLEAVAAGDARLAHPARDDGRVRGHPAVRGEDALRLDQTVDVVGRRLPADEDHRLAGLAVLLGGVGVEDDLPGGGAGRGVEALRRDLELGVRVEARVQELVELGRVDPRDRLVPLDQPFRGHVDRALDRGGRRPLRGARLEEVEVPLLDGELDVLHVAVVALERGHRLEELVVRLGHALAQLGERLRRASPGDDVLALRVDEVLAVDALLAGRGVAREADAGRRVVALVPEDHLDDVDRGAEVVGDRVHAPVDLRARRVPGVEDGRDRAAQLLARVLRKAMPGLVLVDLPGPLDGVVDAEALVRDVVDGLAEHLDQPAVAVAGELLVAGRPREAGHRLVVETDVEDRVHHPGHRDRRPGANGDEQRILGISEALSGLLLEPREMLVDLLVETLDLAAGGHEGAAGVGRDREAGRNGDAELRHLGEPDPLAAEELAAAFRGLVEAVDVAGHRAADVVICRQLVPVSGAWHGTPRPTRASAARSRRA